MNNETLFKHNLRWKYSFISFGIIVLSLLGLIYYTNDSAWLFLGFVGTALSIVLSIIAILITLIDVAGQKGQVLEISESARHLREIVEIQNQKNSEYQESIEKLININLRDTINDVIPEIKSFMSQVESMTEDDKKQFDINTLNNIVNELSKAEKYYNFNNYSESKVIFDKNSTPDFIKSYKIKGGISDDKREELILILDNTLLKDIGISNVGEVITIEGNFYIDENILNKKMLINAIDRIIKEFLNKIQ